MAIAKRRLKATATLRARKGGGSRARVPAAVRDALGAKPGDQVIFEEGSPQAVDLAALKGRYFVVTLNRAEEPAQAPIEAPVPALEPLDQVVKKRIEHQEVAVIR